MARSDIDWGSRPGSNVVELNVSGGEDITGEIDDAFTDGNQVYIPPGDYDADPEVFMTGANDACVVGDPDGVTIQRGNIAVRGTMDGGNVLVENITFRGAKPVEQSRWRLDPPSGEEQTLRNVNWPDGTVECSDSQAVYTEGSGTIVVENCFWGGHGNSLLYASAAGDTRLVVDGCIMGNSNGAIRPSPDGAIVRNTVWFSDDCVPGFCEAGGSGDGDCNGYSRCFKTEESCTVEIENFHAFQTNGSTGPGTIFDFRDEAGSVDGYIDGAYVYNETDANIANDGSWDGSVSNFHVSGPGDTDVPWPVAGSTKPDMRKLVWTPVQDGGLFVPGGGCESDADCPEGRVCDGERCVAPRLVINGDANLGVKEAEVNRDTLVRTVHEGYTGPGFLDLEPPNGAFAEWKLDVETPGDYDLNVRFSNGDSSERTCRLRVGNVSYDATFPSTGGWNVWQTKTFGVALPEGETKLSFETTGEDAGQLDSIDLVPRAECSGDGDCPEGQVCRNGECVPTDDNGGGDTPQRSGGAGMLLLAAGLVGAYVYEKRQGNKR